MAAPIKITRLDLGPAGLRREARRASSVAASRRMLALALVLEGVTRTEAAQAAGMERQTLRDWVHRYNEDGLAGLADRPGEFGPKRFLLPEQEAEVAEMVRRGPVLAEHGVVRWRRADLARAIEVKFGVVLGRRSRLCRSAVPIAIGRVPAREEWIGRMASPGSLSTDPLCVEKISRHRRALPLSAGPGAGTLPWTGSPRSRR